MFSIVMILFKIEIKIRIINYILDSRHNRNVFLKLIKYSSDQRRAVEFLDYRFNEQKALENWSKTTHILAILSSLQTRLNFLSDITGTTRSS